MLWYKSARTQHLGLSPSREPTRARSQQPSCHRRCNAPPHLVLVAFSDVEAEEGHVTIVHRIFLALEADFASLAGREIRAGRLQFLEGNHLCLDEPALEVAVDDPRRLGGTSTLAHGPGPDFGLTRSQECEQSQEAIGCPDEGVQGRLFETCVVEEGLRFFRR